MYEKELLLKNKSYSETPFNYSSIQQFLTRDLTTPAVFNALVTGGRCNNEVPSEFLCKHTADIDLTSCYGTALEAFIFPLGIPSVYKRSPNKTKTDLTLKQFLDRYEASLLPNLFKITISGSLSFEQDLVYSKLVTEKSLRNTIHKSKKSFDSGVFDDTAHIHSKMVLVRSEIENGVITSDILEVIKNVSSGSELKEWLDLDVITAVWYRKENQIKDPQEWAKELLSDPDHIEFDTEGENQLDKRSKKWCGVPLREFISPLIRQRNELKKQLGTANEAFKNECGT